jgi:4-amino-4-deoxy-L-arabinose transferase-like glycosyltransferase
VRRGKHGVVPVDDSTPEGAEPVRRLRYRRGYGFGHLFGLLFLFRHPAFLVVVAVVVLVVYMARKRR